MHEGRENTSLVKIVRDKGQYVIAFGVIASLLVVANIPIFVVFFFGVFAYFMAKMFSAGNKTRTRAVFEFYLSAHEILRDDLRRWYGFEINETINRGQQILKEMHNAPPLVHYALGALYNKIGDHSSAIKHLSHIAENPESFESSIVYPTPELRSYVNVLRKIEREPSEAPLTSAAVRALERARKLKTDTLLEQSRTVLAQTEKPEKSKVEELPTNGKPQTVEPSERNGFAAILVSNEENERKEAKLEPSTERPSKRKTTAEKRMDPSRKPITEVLHDIYDRNVQ
ncbi:MAG TPA: hypothetical protein VMS29_03610 [Pyrinomonadaceae bacterium]|nr:hypothetical protein [Pyrinomonadaceae bacterium]